VVVVFTELKRVTVPILTADEETAEGRREVKACERHGEGILGILGIERS
jgi:hypothetical protein